MKDVPAPLPPSAQEIADVIGRDRALFLIGQLPVSGARSWRRVVYIPKRMPLDHPLVALMGWHDAEKLRRTFGGEILQPSNCNCVARAWRNRVICSMAADGDDVVAIADAVSSTVWVVRKVIAGNAPEDRMPRLADDADDELCIEDGMDRNITRRKARA
ncbi:MAG: hypothetical protein ACJA1L_000361 [Paracoccaceae bacterium]